MRQPYRDLAGNHLPLPGAEQIRPIGWGKRDLAGPDNALGLRAMLFTTQGRRTARTRPLSCSNT